MAGSVVLAVCAFILIFIANKDSIYPGLISFSSVSHTRKAPCPSWISYLHTYTHYMHMLSHTTSQGESTAHFAIGILVMVLHLVNVSTWGHTRYGYGVATAMGASVGGIYWLLWWGVIKGFNMRQNICVTAKTESMWSKNIRSGHFFKTKHPTPCLLPFKDIFNKQQCHSI